MTRYTQKTTLNALLTLGYTIAFEPRPDALVVTATRGGKAYAVRVPAHIVDPVDWAMEDLRWRIEPYKV